MVGSRLPHANDSSHASNITISMDFWKDPYNNFLHLKAYRLLFFMQFCILFDNKLLAYYYYFPNEVGEKSGKDDLFGQTFSSGGHAGGLR